MRLFVDRFENDTAVLNDVDNNSYLISRVLLPQNISEGTVIILDENAIHVDIAETERLKKKNSSLFRKLVKKGGK